MTSKRKNAKVATLAKAKTNKTVSNSTMKKPESKDNNQAKSKTRSKFVSGENIKSKFVECAKTTWTIEGILPSSSILTCIYGKHSSFKSFLTMDMLMSIAIGKEYHGRKTLQMPILYVCAEGGAGAWKRIIAWHQHHGIDTISDNIIVHDGAVNLNNLQARAEFIRQIKSLPIQPGIIVCDTLARCFSGKDENSNSEMSVFINACSDISEQIGGAQVVVVHHAGKDASKGTRGGSALPGGVDTEMYVKAGANDIVALANTKQKDAEEFDTISFKMLKVFTDETDPNGYQITSLVPEMIKTNSVNKPLSDNAKLSLEALKIAQKSCKSGAKNQASCKSNYATPKLWRNHYDILMGSEHTASKLKSSFYRAKDELFSKNKIVADGNNYAIAVI